MIEHIRDYFGFDRQPFTRSIPAASLHQHAGQQEAIARLSWAIAERGIAVLTGEVGAGKSVAVRAATASLDPARHTIIYLGNPSVGSTGIYAAIVRRLGAVPRHHKFALVPQAMELLAAEETERGRLTVLVIDEAHLLANEQLEDLRLLTNSEMDSHSPLAVVLIGQPTLRRKVKMGTLAALDQRITARCHIEGMNLIETKTYIVHHVKTAGRADPLFTDEAIAEIHKTSRGLPRAVNNLAVHSMIAAFAVKKNMVDITSARKAVAEATAD